MSGDASKFDLVAAETLEDALRQLAAGRRPIAGGTDLMVLFEAGVLRHRRLVSVRSVTELRTIDVVDERVDIGACVTYAELRAHPVLQRELRLLCQAASWTGGMANQNRGTLGGNIANGSPAADSAPVLLAYEAEVELVSLRGSRWLRYAEFHTGYKTMRMEADELLTRIRVPRPRGEWIEYGRKVGARKAQAISKLALAAVARMEGARIAEVRIAMASVAPVPFRCRATESVLTGAALTEHTRQRAREALIAEIAPIDDIRSTAAYRRHVAANLVSEFLDLLGAPAVLREWNAFAPRLALERIRKCCGSEKWAREMTERRPFTDAPVMLAAADRIWGRLSTEDRLEAFRSHPRIGDAAGGWAAGEQSGMSGAGAQLRTAMAEANREYESRFGFIYIVCATGKTAEEMLALLQRRLTNDRAAELEEASEQQRQIMQLRLRKWLAN